MSACTHRARGEALQAADLKDRSSPRLPTARVQLAPSKDQVVTHKPSGKLHSNTRCHEHKARLRRAVKQVICTRVLQQPQFNTFQPGKGGGCREEIPAGPALCSPFCSSRTALCFPAPSRQAQPSQHLPVCLFKASPTSWAPPRLCGSARMHRLLAAASSSLLYLEVLHLLPCRERNKI